MIDTINLLLKSKAVMEFRLKKIVREIKNIQSNCQHDFDQKVINNGSQTHTFMECKKCGMKK